MLWKKHSYRRVREQGECKEEKNRLQNISNSVITTWWFYFLRAHLSIARVISHLKGFTDTCVLLNDFCPHLIALVLIEKVIMIFKWLVMAIFNDLFFVGVYFLNQTYILLFPRSTDTWTVKIHGNLFFISAPYFFLSLVPIKRPKIVLTIFLAVQDILIQNILHSLYALNTNWGPKFFVYNFLRPFIHPWCPLSLVPNLLSSHSKKEGKSKPSF